eukprot:SAG31_NODE_2033_length_6618_cov_3.628624_7_plen_893_part_00
MTAVLQTLLALAMVLVLVQPQQAQCAFIAEAPQPASGPYYLLKPRSFADPLGDDLGWAEQNIPLFESANSTLDLVYYFRWRTYKSHIHPTNCSDVAGFKRARNCRNRTDGIDFVVTEFSPDVSWAGEYNTINCAAGHHMLEGGWLRQPIYMDSYTRWWVTAEARHNYFYWYATALLRNFQKNGNVGLLKKVVPAYKMQFAQYATGKLPRGAMFSTEHDCLWNSPGNEGQEQSISGPGCRTLIQSMMYGEASSLSKLLEAIGDHVGAKEMNAEAELWQRRVLQLWNENITGFDTLRISPPRPPPAPPPSRPPCGIYNFTNCPTRCQSSAASHKCTPPPPPPFNPPGWHVLPGRNGTECLPRAYLWEGQISPAVCIAKCEAIAACNFVTIEIFPPNRPGGGYCNLVGGNCSQFNGWDNKPCSLPPPDCVPQNNLTSSIATFARDKHVGFELLPTHNGTFCCDQTPCENISGHISSTFVYQGADNMNECFLLCRKNSKCRYVTWHAAGSNKPWCFNSEYCNTTSQYSGHAGLPTPQEILFVHTWEKQHQPVNSHAASAVNSHEGAADSAATAAVALLAGVRELASLSSPWYFGAIPAANATLYAASWNTAFDSEGLAGEFGLRTAERRNPHYFCDKPRPGPGGGCCSWSGPMWPFESAKAITAAISVLNDYPTVNTVDKDKLWHMMWQYTAMHTPLWKITNCSDGTYFNIGKQCSSGAKSVPSCCYGGHLPLPPNVKHTQPGWPSCPAPLEYTGCDMCDWVPTVPGVTNPLSGFWIGENGCADGGDPAKGLTGPSWVDGATEGYEYNHSTFIDLILSGLVGLRPSTDGRLTVNPLVPPGVLPWWTADGIALHGRIVSIRFDMHGSHYGEGKGLKVYVDGKLATSSPTMRALHVQL